MNLDFKLNLNAISKPRSRPEISDNKTYDLIVIGGGPAGLNAALYAKRKGLETAIIATRLGGLVLDTSSVENYLGYSLLSGEELVGKFVDHVESLEIPLLKDTNVLRIEKNVNDLFVIHSGNGSFISKTLLAATGSTPRKLGVKGEQEFSGKGVAYCAICDGPLYKGRDVIVAGGGNSALEAAIDLSKLAAKVTIVHRSTFRADRILLHKLDQLKNIEVVLDTVITEIKGSGKAEEIIVTNKSTGRIYSIRMDGIFIEIGHEPNSSIFKNLADLNEQNEIIIDRDNMTKTPGLFAAGDVTTIKFKQIQIAASEGAKAALSISDYINKR